MTPSLLSGCWVSVVKPPFTRLAIARIRRANSFKGAEAVPVLVGRDSAAFKQLITALARACVNTESGRDRLARRITGFRL